MEGFSSIRNMDIYDSCVIQDKECSKAGFLSDGMQLFVILLMLVYMMGKSYFGTFFFVKQIKISYGTCSKICSYFIVLILVIHFSENNVLFFILCRLIIFLSKTKEVFPHFLYLSTNSYLQYQ
jgi:hypothetical protein